MKGYLNMFAKILPKRIIVPVRYYYHWAMGVLEDEVRYLPQLIPRRGKSIDVGAFNGDYTYILSTLSKSVESFEPQPELADIISNYSNSKINVHNFGLADIDDNLELQIPNKAGRALASFRNINGPCDKIVVPVRRLDDFNFKDVTFIKIDVEGFESKVIDGGRATILREMPVMLIEIEQRHLNEMEINIDDVFKQVLELGYSGFYLKRGVFMELKTFSYEVDQEPYLNNPHNNNYINNFIFKPIKK